MGVRFQMCAVTGDAQTVGNLGRRCGGSARLGSQLALPLDDDRFPPLSQFASKLFLAKLPCNDFTFALNVGYFISSRQKAALDRKHP